MSRRLILGIVFDCMQPKSPILRSLSDPRYRLGWFDRAREFLESAATRDGGEIKQPVVQHHVTSSSTLLRVLTSRGWYYLKSPALGCAEVTVTSQIASIFPQSSPMVLGISTELNCFASKGFDHMMPSEKHLSNVVMELGCLQLKSLPHVSTLVHCGCPLRTPDMLLKKLETWADGSGITANCTEAMDQCRAILPIVRKMASTINRSKLPATLVHGDASLSNATYTQADCDSVFLFDWQFAYVGHPFFDLHRLHKDCPHEVLKEYLGLWVGFEDLEDLHKTYRVAWKIG